MQISDLVGQYNNSTQKPQVTGTTGTKKLASTLREMKSGSIFEGTVNSVKGGQVILGLSNGQTVTARLEGKVSLAVGQSMFFQVKSTDDGTIAIRPYTVGGNSMNLTLMDALKAANLPIDERNLNMVNSMMKEQMSIDRGSLNQMSHTLSSYPDTSVDTLIQMQKLNIPITTENVSGFENYKLDQQALTTALDDFILELPKTLISGDYDDGQMQQIGKELLSVATDGLSEHVEIPPSFEAVVSDIELFEVNGVMMSKEEIVASIENGTLAMEDVEHLATDIDLKQESISFEDSKDTQATQENANTEEAIVAENAISEEVQIFPKENQVPYTLGSVLSKGEIHHLEKLFSDLMPETEDGEKISVSFSRTDSTVSVLNALRDRFASGEGVEGKSLKDLFSSKEFHVLVKDALEQQWLIKPEELKDSKSINRLYEKMEEQLERMNHIVKSTGQESSKLSEIVSDIKSNIEFMNQINEAYTYVQIPLKLTGQNASGELYVYTNKKKLAEHPEELSAFLHLDMDHLGSTDVSVKMLGKEVNTKFYFDNDAAYEIVEANLDKLDARLKSKGYNCNFSVIKEGRHINFVDDFLKKDQPSAGMVHRYSFDVRA